MRRQSARTNALNQRKRRRNTLSEDLKQDTAESYVNKLQAASMVLCASCPRGFLNMTVNREGLCTFCASGKQFHYSDSNDMDPGEVPEELKHLTMIEEMLIARIHPIVQLYKIHGNQTAYSGNIINFKQDVTHLFNSLPPTPNQVNAIILAQRNTPNRLLQFKVRANTVRRALVWLKNNHRYYSDIHIDEDALQNLPENGDYSSLLNSMADINVSETDNQNIVSESFVMQQAIIDQQRVVQESVFGTINWPDQDNAPINEFTSEGYVTLAFPTLFPFGKADINFPRREVISPTNYFKFLLEYKDQRFAKHARFRYFALNTLMRRTGQSISNVYIKKSRFPGATLDDVRRAIEENSDLANQIMVYSGSLRGTRSYWKIRCGELLDMVAQIGTPTVFLHFLQPTTIGQNCSRFCFQIYLLRA